VSQAARDWTPVPGHWYLAASGRAALDGHGIVYYVPGNPLAKQNRWHPVMLPDDYLQKLKQDHAESDSQAMRPTLWGPCRRFLDYLQPKDAPRTTPP
jgi:hypothetical protein